MAAGTLQNDQCNSCAPIATCLVTVAGSAGALEPLSRLLAMLPPEVPAAVVAMVHCGPGSLLPEILRGRSRLPVSRATDGTPLRRGHLYAAGGGAHLIVNPDGRLTTSRIRAHRSFRPSADWLFESSAASFREGHIAVVLSGMLDDGAAELRGVKRRGGTVLVQSPLEARFREMPAAAIATGCTDAVLPVAGLVSRIIECLARREALRDGDAWESPFASGAVSAARTFDVERN